MPAVIKDRKDVEEKIPQMDGVKDATMRMLLGKEDGVPNFYMREFTVASGGHTPLHSHNYEHEIYILEGRGALQCGDETRPLSPGQAIYIPANSLHQFRNDSDGDLRFICLVPSS